MEVGGVWLSFDCLKRGSHDEMEGARKEYERRTVSEITGRHRTPMGWSQKSALVGFVFLYEVQSGHAGRQSVEELAAAVIQLLTSEKMPILSLEMTFVCRWQDW